MSKCKPLTKKEEEWIKEFKKICKKCPKKLWLFSANGTLNIMKTPDDGETLNDNGGCNQDNVVDWANITNDGGDW